VTCLIIATKIEEIYPPKLHTLVHMTDGACTADEVYGMELVILESLGWGLSPMTPNSWVKLYMQVSDLARDVEAGGSNLAGDQDLVQPRFSAQSFTGTMQLLDLCILDMGSLSFPYSVLSASAIFLCQGQDAALQSSGIQAAPTRPGANPTTF
jgi:cyclin E